MKDKGNVWQRAHK